MSDKREQGGTIQFMDDKKSVDRENTNSADSADSLDSAWDRADSLDSVKDSANPMDSGRDKANTMDKMMESAGPVDGVKDSAKGADDSAKGADDSAVHTGKLVHEDAQKPGRRSRVPPEPGMKPTNGWYAAAWCLFKVICSIVYPSTIEGLEKLPRHRAVLCPNHASNWDPLILAARLPMNYRLHAMAKKELFENPILGWILRKIGVFPVDRERADVKAVKTAIQTLKDGDNLLIYPEGTVIKNGIGYADGLPAHAKSGAVMIAIRTGAALFPVFQDGPKRPFHRSRIIIGDPYIPRYTGRKGTAEELQTAADEMLVQAYALGGQAVGGKPLSITEKV